MLDDATVPLPHLRRAYRRSLLHAIDALLTARTALTTGEVDAVSAVRRLAHSLTAMAHALPEVVDAARVCDEAPEADLPVALDGLLGELRKAVAPDHVRNRVVLIIDDDRAETGVLSMIAKPYADRVLVAGTLNEARRAVETEPVSIILLDLLLPDGDGRQFLADLMEDAQLKTIPVFVLSARVNAQIRTECLSLGAWEVHEKPLDPVALSTGIAAMCGFQERSVTLAAGDPITGLPDRDMLREAARQVRRRYDVDRKSWCILLFDLDTWRSQLVHDDPAAVETGVRLAAEHLRKVFSRPADVASRWDTATFVVLLPRTGLEEAQSLAELALARLTAAGVTANVGGAEAGPMPLGRAIAVARRLTDLAKASGSTTPLLDTTLDVEGAKRVLVVDDDPSMRLMLRTILEGEGLEVVARNDGLEALEFVGTARVDLVVLDVEMPGLDGLQTLVEIRGNHRFDGLPVVILTATSADRSIVAAFDAGADDYVTKPFSPTVLRARIRNLLARRAPAR